MFKFGLSSPQVPMSIMLSQTNSRHSRSDAVQILTGKLDLYGKRPIRGRIIKIESWFPTGHLWVSQWADKFDEILHLSQNRLRLPSTVLP